MKHPFLMAILSKKKKKPNLKGFCFLVFMLFLKQINLKSHFVFKCRHFNVAILKDDERGCILV
nr:hypothetical protein [Helicobacter pylori]